MTIMYQMFYEMQTADEALGDYAHQDNIVYLARDKITAISAFKRFWDDRFKAMPDHFYKLCAVKLCEYSPGYIKENGEYKNPSGWPCYEWKCDFPWQYGENVK